MSDSWLYIIIGGVIAFVIIAGAPLLFGRLFAPRLTFALIKRFGRRMAKLTDRISPGLDTRLLVKATNRYFKKRYEKTDFSDRIIFLPFCLRPLDCPGRMDRDRGMICPDDCPGCRLGELRDEAIRLGYGQVFIVPSSRMVREVELIPSDQFIKGKLRELNPKAALGVVCDWHLKTRLLPKHRVDGRGYVSDGGQRSGSALQGVLLNCRSCRQASVDWEAVRERMISRR